MWEKCKAWFLHSEVLLWARLQVLVGAVWTVLATADLTAVLNPKALTYWMIINGVITELLRRRGTETKDNTLVSK